MPSPPSLERLQPSYLPEGYQLRRDAPEHRGRSSTSSQAALTYTRGWELDDWLHPLKISSPSSAEASHATTNRHAGDPINLGLPGITAIYHDGSWAPGPGEDARSVGETVIHWERGSVHSITMRGSNGVATVQGSRARGVTRDELVKIARSLLWVRGERP